MRKKVIIQAPGYARLRYAYILRDPFGPAIIICSFFCYAIATRCRDAGAAI